ncbi:MAG: OmpA family protein, partial [Cystobacter sp.]
AALARDRIVRITPRVMLGRSLGWLRAGVEAGALVRPAVVLGDGRTVQDEVGSELLLGAVLATQGTGVRGELNVRGSVPLGARESGALEVLAGLRLPLGSVAEAYALGGPGFGDAPGTPAFRLLLGVALGGVGTAGGRPRAAVASSDDDRDGVPNTEDSCPAEAGPASRRGCPVKDTDKDGIADDHDSCPTRAGPPSTLGCPVPTKDTDKDGISDERDDCPNEAGPASSLGCPVKLEGASRAGDSDKDGVADTLDNCPTEAGAASNQGCPAQQPQLVTLRDGKLELQEQVAFAPGKAVVIQKGSHTLLEQVARVLVQHPELGRVVIEGHTDNRGKAEANRKLSLARAEAVKAFLVGKGVQGARLEARGMGSEQPIRSNLTESGRVANRRMEFIIAPPERQLK